MKSLVVLLGVFAFSLNGCDVIDSPFTKSEKVDTTTTPTTRKILIDEFTGCNCRFCPGGHEELSRLKTMYGDRIIAVSLHAGSFAVPVPPEYTADFRSEFAESLYNDFAVSGEPSAVINRTKFDGTYALGKSAWADAIVTESIKSAEISLDANCTWNKNSNMVEVTINSKYLTEIATPTNIVLYVVEDSIIAPQNKLGTVIPNYIHRDIVRSMPLGRYGTTLTNMLISKGNIVTKSYSFQVEKSWNVEHIKIIAAIIENDGEQKRVIQCQEISLK